MATPLSRPTLVLLPGLDGTGSLVGSLALPDGGFGATGLAVLTPFESAVFSGNGLMFHRTVAPGVEMRGFRMEDAEPTFAVVDRHREYLREWLPWVDHTHSPTEVREFIENDLGPEGLKRSVVIVSTSDQPALVRIRAAFAATAQRASDAEVGRLALEARRAELADARQRIELVAAGLAEFEPVCSMESVCLTWWWCSAASRVCRRRSPLGPGQAGARAWRCFWSTTPCRASDTAAATT